MKEHGFKQRRLDPLKSRKLPGVILFTDSETLAVMSDYGEVQEFTLGWVFTWDSRKKATTGNTEKMFFDDKTLYCKYIEDMSLKYKKIHIYGHNIFFDLQCAGFFRYFSDTGWELDWLYDKGLTYILRIKKDKMIIMALSTTNYFDCSLSELGTMIGLEKKEITFRKASDAQLKNYCYRDTEIVMRAVFYYISFVKDNDLGSMGLTKSSQAFTAYRTRFMDNKIHLHGEDRSFGLEREAYMGGRTEAFRIGQVAGDDFLTLDVNGMYPYVMQKHLYPSKLLAIMEGEKDIRYTESLRGYGMTAEVDLATPEPVFAVRRDKKIIFPTGEFRAFLCTEGVKYALSRGYVRKFIRASIYQMDDLFSAYVKYFTALRDKYTGDGNAVMAKLCKYMLNTLYGKWGQHEILTDMSPNDTGIDYLRREIWDGVHGGWWTETYFMNKIIYQHSSGESNHSFPAIAAHITENARMYLWEIISKTGRDRVLYCDTDSVIIHAADLPFVKHKFSPSDLGALKVDKRFSALVVDGAKNYRTDRERHIKGIPEAAEEISPGVFRYDSFQRQAAALKEGQIEGVKITSVTRRLTHRYDKGQIDSEGRVIPYHLTFFPLPDGQPPPF